VAGNCCTTSTLNGQWQTLTVTAAAGTNPDLIVLYTDNGTADVVGEFYADGAGVAAVPEPSSLTLAFGGVGISVLAWWRRRTVA
jgi:hypothetical protein